MKTRSRGRQLTPYLFKIVGGAVLINPAFAQQPPATDLEEVIVTGQRAALMQSMDIKRTSIGVVDAITAEDIGRFPASNLAESIQRIPGVAIDRSNGEGSQVTVRGFGPGFNLTTLNGRTVPTAEVNVWGSQSNYSGGQGRSFDFSNVASEAVSSIEVFKTGQATMPSGGVGATINIRTRRPLDSHGFVGAVSAAGVMDTSVEDGSTVTPEVSGLFSWTNDADTLGVGVFGGYSRRDSSAAMGQTNDWVVSRANNIMSNSAIVRVGGNPANYVNMPANGTLFAIPQDSRYDASDLSRERMNAQFVAQFRPMDSLTLTADYTYFQNKNEEQRYEQTNWFNTPFDHLTFDGGTPVSHALYMQENNDGAKDMGFEQTNRAQKDKFDSIGFTAEWGVTETGTLRFDAHTDSAKSTPNNPLGHSATFVTIAAPIIQQHSVSWDNPDGFPVQSYTFNDAIKGNGNGKIDVGDLGTQVSRSSAQTQTMDLDEFDLRYTLAADKNRLDFGVNYRTTSVYVKGVTTQQDLGTWGVSNPRDVALYAPGVMEAFCLACRFHDYPVGQADVAFKGDATKLFSLLTPIYQARGKSVTTNSNENWVDEDILAAFAQFGMDNEFFSHPVHINGGLRYEQTKVNSTALQTVPTSIVWTADNDFEIRNNGTMQNVTGKGDYSHLLPNLDVRVDVTDDVVARVSYSKTIGRVPYANLFASTTAGAPNNPTALGGLTGGNSQDPNLLPLESENFDVSVEWYYAKDSYVSVGWFDKKVKNFLGTGVFTRPLFGLRDPSSGAAGTRSGSALAELDRLSLDRSPANLFTMVALMDANNGNLAAASTTFQANLVNGKLPQAYVDQILGQYDVVANAADPEMQFRVTQPINDKEGSVFGWEFAWQHFFGNSGFGAAASYTVVNGDVKADPGQDPNQNQFALVGLSDTANGTLMYEKHGISAHISYNWRDKFLNATNQGGSRSPQFTDAFGQWDASVSYQFNDHLQVVAEGINLTGADHREYRRMEGMTIWAYELAPRYSLGVRYKF